jgi:hypothetical protein
MSTVFGSTWEQSPTARPFEILKGGFVDKHSAFPSPAEIDTAVMTARAIIHTH